MKLLICVMILVSLTLSPVLPASAELTVYQSRALEDALSLDHDNNSVRINELQALADGTNATMVNENTGTVPGYNGSNQDISDGWNDHITSEVKTPKALSSEEKEQNHSENTGATNAISAASWYRKGEDLFNQKKYEEAVAAYDKVLAINPIHAEAWFGKGNALKKLGKYEEALEAYNQELNGSPDDPLGWYNKGNTLLALSRYEEAIGAYDQSLQYNPEYANAWNNKGVALQRLERYEEAITAADQALKIDPQHADAWNNKGVDLKNLGRYEEAIKAYDQALQLEPEKPSLWSNKGNALLELGKYKEALEAYDKALSIDPDFSQARENRKIAEDRSGQSGSGETVSGKISGPESLTPGEATGSNQLSVSVEPDSVLLGDSFTVSITGAPGGEYYIWTKKTSPMSGMPEDQPPMIGENQKRLQSDPVTGPYTNGRYQFEEGEGKFIKQDVPDDPDYHGTRSYGIVTLDNKGKGTVTFTTSKDTKPMKYIIRVEWKMGGTFGSGEVPVQVHK